MGDGDHVAVATGMGDLGVGRGRGGEGNAGRRGCTLCSWRVMCFANRGTSPPVSWALSVCPSICPSPAPPPAPSHLGSSSLFFLPRLQHPKSWDVSSPWPVSDPRPAERRQGGSSWLGHPGHSSSQPPSHPHKHRDGSSGTPRNRSAGGWRRESGFLLVTGNGDQPPTPGLGKGNQTPLELEMGEQTLPGSGLG